VTAAQTSLLSGQHSSASAEWWTPPEIVDPARAEEWRPIAGYGGLYEVSSFGRVRSFKRGPFSPNAQRVGGAIIRKVTQDPTTKYLHLPLSRPGDGKRWFLVHVLVLEAFAGPRPDGCVARHKNRVRTDNRSENLQWGTPTENAQDAIAHGTAPRGITHGFARFRSADVVHEIRLRARAGEPLRQIAAEYGVGAGSISRIKSGIGYASVPEEPHLGDSLFPAKPAQRAGGAR
jgi:hypothetical protein